MLSLIQSIQKIATDKSRCSELLSGLADPKLLPEHQQTQPQHANQDPSNLDPYWLILGTHTVSRFVKDTADGTSLGTNEQMTPETAIVLSLLCHQMATLMVCDRGRLERMTTSFHPVVKFIKSVLGRATVSICCGSTVVLEKLTYAASQQTSREGGYRQASIRRALWMALSSLEMVISLSLSKASVSVDQWHQAMASAWDDASFVPFETLQHCCDVAEATLNITDEERSALSTLAKAVAAAPPSPSNTITMKRGRRSKAEATAALSGTLGSTGNGGVVNKAFAPILAGAVMFDSRLSIRRSASMAFVWLIQGQKRTMDVALGLLQMDDSDFLSCAERTKTVMPPPSTPSSTSSSSKKKKSSRSKKESPKQVTYVPIPGKVAAVTLASRLLDVVTESFTHCGARAPSGGMDNFTMSLLGQPEHTKRRTKSSKITWTRPDLLNTTRLVSYRLLRVHADCVRETCTLTGTTLLNDDTSGPSSPVYNGTVRFYPYVARTLDGLCKAVTSSSSGVPLPSSHSTTRIITHLGSQAVALTLMNKQPFVDAKLMSFALTDLSPVLSSLLEDQDLLDNHNPDSILSAEQVEKKYGASLSPLEAPIGSPTTAATPTSKTRRRKTSEGSPTATASSSSSTVETTSSFGPEDQLVCYLRAVVSTKKKAPLPAANLLSVLLLIIKSCYNTSANGTDDGTDTNTTPTKEDSKKRGRSRRASSSSSSSGTKRKRRKVAPDKEVVTSEHDNASESSYKYVYLIWLALLSLLSLLLLMGIHRILFLLLSVLVYSSHCCKTFHRSLFPPWILFSPSPRAVFVD